MEQRRREVLLEYLKSSSVVSLSLSGMFEFGDELIIDSYRIPWLIWIQLLVMFLLVILLYYFSTTPSDLSLHFSTATATATASPSATGLSYHRSLLTSTAANNQHNSKDMEFGEIRAFQMDEKSQLCFTSPQQDIVATDLL
ncbi:hypothetical protein Ccrd_013116 [Cynara cardunculus var. scolymus]|uniref:Transmembrane protein n=1 Tax=Cynara cardunculus var. scolymus TaxID=59895 RepID=A0A103YG79_CYNCS|nr:hypothetical protein Ccrd_013116 [Cynara cardunculus var. scolymus]